MMTREGISLPSLVVKFQYYGKKQVKASNQGMFSSSVDIHLLITSMFFLVKMWDELQPEELKKDFVIMQKIANQPEKLSKDEILYAEKCMEKWDKVFTKFQRKIKDYLCLLEIFRWLEERSRRKMKANNKLG